MRRLILFRHAKSDWSDERLDDHDRDLSPRGRRAAGPMGEWLSDRGLRPDLVACSTATRARETWRLAAAAFKPAPRTFFAKTIYLASPGALLEVVRSTPADVQTLLIVGHNPGLEQFVETLASKGDPDALTAVAEKFPTAAVAVIDLPCADWRDAALLSGRLDRFMTPRSLGMAGA